MSRNDELATENKEIYEWIRDNGHLEFVKLASECDDFARGDQWDPGVKAKLAKRRKPHLTINKILATCATLYGEYFVRRGDISFRPSAGGDPDTARVIDKLWMNFCQVQNYDWLEYTQFGDGVVRSRGFLDLRIDFDESMRGEPILSYLNSKDVGLYPGDTGMDPDNWSGVMLTKWLSARDISEIYGVPINDVLFMADSPDLDADYTDWRKDSFGSPTYDHQLISADQRQKYRLLRVLERQEWEYKTVQCFVDVPTGEIREIPEAWDREHIQLAIAQHGYYVTKKRAKKINWVVSVGEMLLHSAISPYRHFTPIPYFPFVIGGRPIGIVQHLRDPQNLLNKTLSQELHIVAGIANSGFKVKSGALANMTPEQLQERGGEDGLVIETTGPTADVEKLQPNQVPTGLDRLSYTAGEVMQQISLVNDSMQGLNRADEAGKAIDRKAIQGSTSLSPIYAALDQTRRIVARNWLDLVQQFITEERVYHITSRARTAKTEQVEVNKEQFDGSFMNDLTLGEYAITVTNVQARDSYDQNQFDIMMQMVREGAPIPWSETVNALTILENRDEIVEFLKNQEGRSDPSEEQKKRQELEDRMLAAQALDKEASAQVKQAQAQKAQAEGMKEMQGDNSGQIEMAKAQLAMQQTEQTMQLKSADMQMKREAEEQKTQLSAQLAAMELEFARARQQQEMQFAREKHALEMERMRAELSALLTKAELDINTQEIKGDLQEQQMKNDMTMKEQQMKADMKMKEQLARQKAKQTSNVQKSKTT